MKKLLGIVIVSILLSTNVNGISIAKEYHGSGEYKHPYNFEFDTIISCPGIVIINEEKKIAWWNSVFFSKIKIKEKNGYKIYSGHRKNFISKGGPTTFKIDTSKGKGYIKYHMGNGNYKKNDGKCEVDSQFAKDYYEENKKKFYEENKQEEKPKKTEKTTSTNKSVIEELKELKKLYDEGVLTKEQFEKAKNKLLN